MKIAVLFDGAGLARLGLEQAGHECYGFEIDPIKVHLGSFVGSGNVELEDVLNISLKGFDAAWCSPPCQKISFARTQGSVKSEYSQVDYTDWSLRLNIPDLWVENVVEGNTKIQFGTIWNAGQFSPIPIQNRNRVIGGRYISPTPYHKYQKHFPEAINAIVATEYKGCASDQRRASRDLQRKLTIEECASYQGFEIPDEWYDPLPGFTESQWMKKLYEAIGNGVPVYMAKAFGEVYPVD